MTDIVWGPEIRVDGKRPEWLSDDHQQIAYTRGASWYGYTMQFFVADAGNAYPGWASVTAIRLPGDHPHYSKEPTTPELDPALWDRIVHVIARHVACKTLLHDADEGPNCSVEAEFRALASLLKPVDPDLIEARQLNVEHSPNGREIADGILAGKYDDHASTKGLLAAIKRGRALQRGEA